MPTYRSSFALPLSALFLSLVPVGCGGDDNVSSSGSSSESTTAGAGGAGGGGGAGGTNATTGAGGGGGGAGQAHHASFHYKPEWPGVTAVSVIGGFGQAKDWDPTAPFLSLTKGADGTWSGSADLPDGTYAYLFQVTGDAASGDAKFARYALDPANAAFVACPSGSPTFNMMTHNPCSQEKVPEGPADPVYHVKGTVTYDGKGVAGYLVALHRQEEGSHHFFANRTTTGADGTFDLVTTTAQVELQVLHPTYLSRTDAERDPKALAAMRRAISSPIKVAADVTVNPAEVAYHEYAKLAPATGAATLPTTFQISVLPGAQDAQVAVYGSAKAPIVEIGDPWFASRYGATTSVAFDGTFNTQKATEMKVTLGEKYFWGTWQRSPAPPGGVVTWSGESMVLPITWH